MSLAHPWATCPFAARDSAAKAAVIDAVGGASAGWQPDAQAAFDWQGSTRMSPATSVDSSGLAGLAMSRSVSRQPSCRAVLTSRLLMTICLELSSLTDYLNSGLT